MIGLAWDAVCDEFVFDGSWRDIYLFRTEIADWQRMLDALREAGYSMAYFRDGQSTELPHDASQAFPLPEQCDRHLSVRFADVQANCHFFTVEEIEFDIDPREVKGQRQLDALFAFMRRLAEAVSKEAVLTPENSPDTIIFRVRPGQPTIAYQSFGGRHDWKT